MKKEIVLFAILCLLVLNVAIAQAEGMANETRNGENEENGTTENKDVNNISAAVISVRYEIVKHGYERTIVAMNKVIDYFKNKGRNVSVLESLKEQFTSEFNKLSSITDPSIFGKTVAEMHKIAANFKMETAKLSAPQEMGEIRKLINAAISENETLKEIKTNITQKKLQLYNRVCRFNFEKIQAFIERLRERRGLEDVTTVTAAEIDEMQNKLNEMEEACTSINEKVEKVEKRVEEIDYKIKNISRITKEIEDRSAMIAMKINKMAVKKAIEITSKLENRGMNVSSAIEKLNIVSTKIQNITNSCATITEENRIACIEAIKDANREIRKMGKTISVISRKR